MSCLLLLLSLLCLFTWCALQVQGQQIKIRISLYLTCLTFTVHCPYFNGRNQLRQECCMWLFLWFFSVLFCFHTFILKKVMLVRRSTVDLRSWRRALLLAGKLFCRHTHTHRRINRSYSFVAHCEPYRWTDSFVTLFCFDFFLIYEALNWLLIN